MAIHRYGIVLVGVSWLLASGNSAAQTTPREAFDVLNGAPTGTDLPLGNQSSGSTLGGNLRPDLTYPTLRLDAREPREPQAVQAAPALALDTPVLETSPFHEMVRQSLGRALPVFGYKLFRDNPQGFEPVDRADIPAGFVLGVGDEVQLRAWGTIDLDVRVTVDRNGNIDLPKIGQIRLRGVRYGDLRDHLHAEISRYYHNFQLSVSLGQIRAIQVYVTGFAAVPGSYTVSALASPLNVLFYAGGPDKAGDLRRVELRRDGVTVTTFDFYDFLRYGDVDHRVRMAPGDVLHVPPIQGEVAIAGAVNRPGIYQHLPGESLAAIVDLAGGLGVTASSHRVVVERIDADNARVVTEFSLNDQVLEAPVQDGDIILIQPISPRFLNAVTLRGHVAQPLRHQWREGMTVSDLLPDADALIAPGYWIKRNEQSQVTELLKREPGREVAIDFPHINWEYAVIERTSASTLTANLIPFDLHLAIYERDPAHDLLLRPGDRITIFSLQDFRTRREQRPRFIRVEGEVEKAGIYPATPDQTLSDVIRLAGGLTDDAYLFGLEFSREAVRRQQQKRIDESIDQLEQDYYRHLIDRSRNVLTGDLSMSITPEAAAIRGLVEQLREAEPTGRMVLELDADIASVTRLPSIRVDDGDRVYIPSRPPTIEVVGAVYRQGSFVYREDRVRRYVEQAGLLDTADPKNIYVIRPDGSFRKADRSLRLRHGDTVIVPEKVDRQRTVRRIKDWTQVLYQFGLGAAGLNLLEVF